MGADYYFRMGCTHAICQDYAIAGTLPDGRDYALLSDGCSGKPDPKEPGSPYTDFGARLVVRGAQRYLGEMTSGIFPARLIAHAAEDMARQMELPVWALDATLLAAASAGNGYVHTYHTADGIIAHRRRDGSVRYRSRQFGNNMPYYLSYLLNSRRERDLLHPNPEGKSAEYLEAVGKITVTDGCYTPGKGWDKVEYTESLLEPGVTIEERRVISAEESDVVLLISDGIQSFQVKKNGTPVPVEEVLEVLFDFINLKGVFVVRNCNYLLQKVCVQRGWQHTDDFSVAGIHLEKPNAEKAVVQEAVF